ncbi:hypothetical protein ACO0LV_01855 [Pseudactinotalea sp. Z1739]|uniref:hypothetical protein n=1 Tax=Pseudactinotalea sp. Z1739 TaxID=3413028 RepID=UPI003C7BBFFE
MSTDGTPEDGGRFGDMAARIFELEHELTTTSADLDRTRKRLTVAEAALAHRTRLLDSAKLISRAASHGAAAEALQGARDFHPNKGGSWRSHLKALAAWHWEQRRALEVDLQASLGKRRAGGAK